MIPFKRNVVDPKVKNPNLNTKSNVNRKGPKKIFGPIRPFWPNKRPKRGETKIQTDCKKPRPLCPDWVHKKENSENFKGKKEEKRKQSISNKIFGFYYVEYFNLFFLQKTHVTTLEICHTNKNEIEIHIYLFNIHTSSNQIKVGKNYMFRIIQQFFLQRN